MERRGRPVFGAVAGALFFFFLGLTLMVFGVIPLNGPWLAFPLLGLAVGALWGAWAPLGRNRQSSSSSRTLVPGLPVSGQATTSTTSPAWTVRRVTEEVPAVAPDVEPGSVAGPAPGPADGVTTVQPTVPGEPVWSDEPNGPPVPPAQPADDEGPPPHQPPPPS